MSHDHLVCRHLATVLPTFLIGTVQLVRRKGSRMHCIIFCLAWLVATGALGAEPVAVVAEVALRAALDEPRGYCLDVIGSQRRAMPERGLQTHTCYSYQGRIAVDQGFDVVQLRAGRWRLPAFEVCMSVAEPAAGARLQLARCDESPAQGFSLMPDGRISAGVNPALCVTAGADSGRPGGGELCCGRTLLAAGMPERARARATELLAVFLPFAERGIAIVGLEPSCLLTLRDEMQVMGLGEAAATVGAQAMLFEEFVVREARAGRFVPVLTPAARPILVHGHCHQKAFGTVPKVLEALRLIPGAEPALIESSCCGMAGSFGYEAEHYDISLAMAELSLLPALRRAPDALVVADGTSCRHQIADGVGREALHLARVLRDRLA